MKKDEIVGWHHQLAGHEFEQAPGFGDGQGTLVYTVHGIAKSWTRLSNFHLAMLAPYVRNKIQTSFNSVQSLSHV